MPSSTIVSSVKLHVHLCTLFSSSVLRSSSSGHKGEKKRPTSKVTDMSPGAEQQKEVAHSLISRWRGRDLWTGRSKPGATNGGKAAGADDDDELAAYNVNACDDGESKGIAMDTFNNIKVLTNPGVRSVFGDRRKARGKDLSKMDAGMFSLADGDDEEGDSDKG
ncbi:hypothetical protein JCM21900_002703 [Sporobolomyces salmonicolor]